MAYCNPSTLLQANPFVELSQGDMKACELQLLRQWAGSTETPDQILAKAANSGFINLSPGIVDDLECQLLCNIRNL